MSESARTGAGTRSRRPLEERHDHVAGLPLFWHQSDAAERLPPVLYLHGVPTSADDWLPFLERTGGLAPDLPGFGRSGKPAAFDYSIDGYRRFLEAFLDRAGVGRLSLVVHDWGTVGLALAQNAPERIERLVVINAVPLLEGYRWHPIARMWRAPLLGELAMGASTRWGFKRFLRSALAEDGPVPDDLIDRAWNHFDHGTQRAILKLYRSAPSHVLAQAGRHLGDLRCPALVLWGVDDPYLPTSFAEAYANALGGPTRLELVEGAGHWPWIDRPETIETVTGFLGAS